MKPRIRVVLVRPRNPQNIGACARAMANFGFSDLAVVDPYEPVWKETRSAPGAEQLVLKARKFPTIAQATRGFRIVLGTSSFHQRRAEQAVVGLPEWRDLQRDLPAGKIAILFGSERSGLSNEELAACRAVIRIPTDAGTPSMNLAQAVAVTLYELTRPIPSSPVVLPTSSPAALSGGSIVPTKTMMDPGLRHAGMTTGDPEPLIHSWIDLAAASGYPPGYNSAARTGRIRQAVMGIQTSAEAQRFLLSFSRWLRKKLP